MILNRAEIILNEMLDENFNIMKYDSDRSLKSAIYILGLYNIQNFDDIKMLIHYIDDLYDFTNTAPNYLAFKNSLYKIIRKHKLSYLLNNSDKINYKHYDDEFIAEKLYLIMYRNREITINNCNKFLLFTDYCLYKFSDILIYDKIEFAMFLEQRYKKFEDIKLDNDFRYEFLKYIKK